MVSGSSYVEVFGGNAVKPAQASYLALTISVNTALNWPLETTSGGNVVAAQIDVTATIGGLELMMPPGNTGSNGVQTIINNVGANSFTVTDQAGNAIAAPATTQAWIITLTDNSTPNGTWEALQLASTTSSASAASLAGYGLQAAGAQLQVNWPTVYLNANAVIRASNRSNVIVWYGALGALQLDLIANLGVGWVCGLTNEGTDSVTLVGSAGQTINGGAILTVEPGSSGLIFCSASGFNTIGVLVTVIPIVSGGTGATTAAGALTNLGGTAVGQSIFTAPSAASVIALLGLNNFTFKESSISASQSLAAGSSNTGFVCTAPLTLSLPLTTTLTNTFIFAVYAQGGAVTVVPQASDQINNQTAGANLVLPQGTSAMFFTDADGNWWPFFVSTQNVPGSWAIAGGTADVITAAYSPANTALTDGLLLGFRASAANVTTTPTLNPDGLGAATITDLGGNPVNVGAIPAQYAEMLVRYNLANTRWELLNPSPVLTRWAVAGGTVNAITVSPTPVLPALLDGALVWFRASGANTIAAPTLSVSGLAAHPITNIGGAALLPGAIPAQYAEMIVRYNLANTRWELLNPAVTTANQQTQGAISGLKVNVSSGTTVAVAATSVSVGNGSGSYYQATAVSVSINSAVNGANGLDTGALGASTWYAVFAIYNPATATVAGLMSLSGTAPTLPSGYTFFARVGWVLTNSGSALIGTLQYGRRAQYVVGGTNLTTPPVMISGSSGSVTTPTWTAVAVAAFVPITATVIRLLLIASHQTSYQGALAAPNNSYGATGSTSNPPPLGYRTQGTSGLGNVQIQGEFILESTNIYYAGDAGATGLFCLGWEDNW